MDGRRGGKVEGYNVEGRIGGEVGGRAGDNEKNNGRRIEIKRAGVPFGDTLW